MVKSYPLSIYSPGLRSFSNAYSPMVRSQLSQGFKRLYSQSSSQSQGRSQTGRKKRRTIESGVNTYQHDSRLRYRRKSMPKKKRLRWKRFKSKVKAVDLGMQPLQMYTYNNVANVSCAINTQGVFSFMNGGMTVGGNDELFQIFNDAYSLAGVIASAKNYKIFVKSLCLDLQITNTGSNVVILDVYKVKCRKEYSSNVSLDSQWTTAIGENNVITAVASSKPPLTLFDAPNFCSYWRVISKKEIILGGGLTTTMQLRNPMNKSIDGKMFITAPQAYPGYTEGYVFMFRGAPENNAGTARLSACTLTWAYQTVCHYAIPPGKTQESLHTA